MKIVFSLILLGGKLSNEACGNIWIIHEWQVHLFQ